MSKHPQTRAERGARSAVATTMMALLSVLVSSAADPHPLAGQWCSTVSIDDTTDVELVLDIEQVDGRWVGQFDVVQFGVEDYPLNVAVTDSTVTLLFSAVDADFTGILSTDGKALTGVSIVGERTRHIELRKVGEPELSEDFTALEQATSPTLVHTLSADGRELRQRFDADRDHVRLVVLLAPS